jgi:hypothetical protein
MGRGDRTIAVRCMLLLVGVLILPLCSIGAFTAKEHSPAGPSETSIAAAEKQRALPAWTEGSLYIHHISTGRGHFHIRNVAASGVIWTGRGDETEQYIPLHAVKDCHFDENPFSNVIRLSYGKFTYYSGGDIPGVPDYTQPFWRDMETPVAAAVGPVDVMTLDHHGNRDSTNGAILRSLRPRVIIQQNWLSAQPGEEVVVRMASHEFYPGPRDVFSTGMSPETRIAIGPIMDRIYKSYEGHVVVRVAPGGATYEVFVLDDKDTHRRVIANFGPYTAD